MDYANLINTAIRMSIHQAATLIIYPFLVKGMLEQKRSLWYFGIKIIITFLINALLMNTFLGSVYRHETWWIGTYFLLEILNVSISMWMIFYFLYKGDILKIAIANVVAEALDMFFVFGTWIILNWMIGNKNLTSYAGPLNWTDYLLIPISCLVFALATPLLHIIYKKFRAWKPKFRRFYWGVYIAFVFLSQSSYLPSPSDENADKLFIPMLLILVIFTFMVLLLAYQVSRNGQRARVEYQYLERTRTTMEMQHHLLKAQIQRMEENQTRIKKEMEVFVGRHKTEVSNERIRYYLASLQQEFKSLSGGLYSDEWTLDAMLCHYTELCRQQNIPTDFSSQKYQKGSISTEEIYQLLLDLLDQGMQQNQKADSPYLKLHLSTVKNQIIIEYACGSDQRNSLQKIQAWIRKRKWKQKVAKCNGYVQWGREEGKETAVMAVEN